MILHSTRDCNEPEFWSSDRTSITHSRTANSIIVDDKIDNLEIKSPRHGAQMRNIVSGMYKLC